MTGVWDLKAGQVTIFRFEINDNGKARHATWFRPEHFESDGASYSRIRGAAVRRDARSFRYVDCDIELVFPSSDPNAPPLSIRFRAIDAGRVSAAIQGSGLDPFDLVRSTKAQPLGPWDPAENYIPTIRRTTNAEMTAIFNADQADRAVPNMNWDAVGPADQKRRERTSALLESGALQSGEDYYHAAFVFQHGSTADDFLKAHLLAMVALARDKPTAAWIAAASLDRYLQTIGRPQVIGTQFQMPSGSPVTQEPYNRTLISDELRKALHVPSVSAQEQQRREFEAKVKR